MPAAFAFSGTLLLAVVVGVGVALTAWRARLPLGPRNLTLRGPLRERVVPWDRLERLEVGRAYRYGGRHGRIPRWRTLHVRVRGEQLPLVAIATNRPRRELPGLVAEVDRLLAVHGRRVHRGTRADRTGGRSRRSGATPMPLGSTRTESGVVMDRKTTGGGGVCDTCGGVIPETMPACPTCEPGIVLASAPTVPPFDPASRSSPVVRSVPLRPALRVLRRRPTLLLPSAVGMAAVVATMTHLMGRVDLAFFWLFEFVVLVVILAVGAAAGFTVPTFTRACTVAGVVNHFAGVARAMDRSAALVRSGLRGSERLSLLVGLLVAIVAFAWTTALMVGGLRAGVTLPWTAMVFAVTVGLSLWAALADVIDTACWHVAYHGRAPAPFSPWQLGAGLDLPPADA